MQLFMQYGVQSSVPPKTVVAVISPGIEAISYNITARNTGHWMLWDINQENNIYPTANWSNTDYIDIYQSTSIQVNDINKFSLIGFYDSNFNYLGRLHSGGNGSLTANGYLGQITSTTINLPNNTRYINFSTEHNSSTNWNTTSLSNFQTLTVSYGGSSTINYSFTLIDNNVRAGVGTTGYLESGRTWAYTIDWVTLAPNTEFVYPNQWNVYDIQMLFRDNTGTVIEFWNWNTVKSTQYPNNAVEFAVIVSKNPGPSFSTFTQYPIAYLDPTLIQTVTFFDEYPNGTQIGDAVEVVTPVDYNVTFVDNSVWTQDQGIPYAINDWTRTEKIQIIDNSINISNELYTRIFFWDNSTFIGYYGPPTDVKQLGSNPYDFTIPNNATHFALDAIKVSDASFTPYDVISATQFKTITISTGGAITVDPPATYKIRQLVFE